VLHSTLRTVRRTLVAIIGTSVILVGLAMVFLPGPAFVVIPAGIAILATEFLWARWMLRRVRQGGSRLLRCRRRRALHRARSRKDGPKDV